ncbi:LOW QUALITY PROTEIN: tyrosine-protein phosphatase non-receptor type 23-like [Palaemon carinicauda]|uniref:LOW QUALITY PROTEIN: tyrosine-protein phosphatase non-receptor type 23-like n=1 Tax=Palaemon carinicauda TaxID=392227 RepID=UPI0035B60C74
MEAVPRLPMLSFELKPSAENVEFGPKLRQYIRDHYNEDPDNYSTEIHELEGLRAGAIHAPRDFTGCSTLKRYYCQLHFLLSRFPLTENSSLAITFNWYDIYSSLSYSVTDIKYEMACILYNIGALHTDLGAMDARNTPDGMKISCTHFQCAAWAFQHLRDTYPQPRESDMNPTLLTFFYNVCLAQAQECILEKSMTDNRKPTIIAKVAMQVVEYLKTAMKNLGSAKSADAVITEIVGGKKLKMWRKYCEFKIAYYGAVALLYQGMQTEEQQKMGERLAYYQAAVDMLSEASKLSKNLEKQELIAESLTFSNDVMGGKLTAAQKENEFVYHEKVPPVSSLAEVKGASLVKGIPFSVNDPEVAGQDIFSKLVPIEAHQHSSMYSEEKAKLLRHICGEIQEKNEELETYLASMQLDSLSLDDNSDALPQELVECCADLSASSGVRKLSDIMNKISNFYHDIDAQLKAIHSLIEEEEHKEKEFLTMMGKRAPNMILGEMKREANKYREAHQSAQDNNTALHRAITNHMANLQLLSKPLDQIVASIPSTSEVEAQADPAARQEVKRLLGKVSEMQAQRARWEDQLRRDLHEDDVTKQLVTNQEDMEEFFKNELKKHDKLVIPLQQNMSAQNNILQALSEANAAYATTRRLTNQVQAQRTEVISSLLASYDAYLNILKKAEDAQEFYHKLEGQVNKLSARVKSVCRVQDEEREEVLSANVKKFTGGAAIPKVPGAPMLPSGQPSAMNPPSASSTSGPKLKDYLQHMKGGGGSVAGAMPSSSNAPSQMGMPGYGYTDATAPYASNMRPAPLGSEQGDALASCAGQLPGGYAPGYASQAGAYQPSAPSPAPSPAPQASGSPHKVPIASPYGAAPHYYAAQQMGSTAYPNATTAGRAVSTTHPSTVAATAPSITTSPSYPPTVSAAVSQPSSRYNSQNPYYGYQASSHTTSTLSSNNNSQLKLPIGSPSQSAGASAQQNPYHLQYGYGPISSPSPGMNSATNGTGGSQSVASGGTSTSTQGYYNYYQHPSTVSSGVSGIPTTMSTTSANTQPAVTHPSYSSSATSPTAGSSNPYSYQYPQAQAVTTPVATDNRGATNMTGHINAEGYMSQAGYANTTSTYYSSQTSATQPGYSGTYATQATGTYNGIAYQAHPPTTTPQSTVGATPNSSVYHPLATTAGHWNTYCGCSPSSITSYTNSQAGRAGTKTSQMGGTTGTNYSYPYSHMTTVPVTTNTTASAGGGTITSQGVYSSTGPQGQAGVQYHQATQYPNVDYSKQQHNVDYSKQQHNVDYSKQQQWAQYRTPQSYQQPQMGATQPQHSVQPPQQQHQQLQQPLSQPQQPQQQTQHPPQQMQPQLPQHQQPQVPQQPPQPQQQVQQQHYPQQPHQQKPQQPQQSTGISNLDLLSGIELTSPPGSQWSPLTPQPAGGGGRPASDTTNAAAGEAGPALPAHSGTAPDVTSTAASSNQLASNVGNTLPNIVSSNTAVTNTPSETSGAVSSSILDLTALAKRKQTVVDPLSDDEMLQRLAGETERLSKLVEGLERKSLNGPTNLDLKWKELSDMLEKECGELKVSVARCYPLKNRFADILPYDHTRVKLPSARDDYINASHVQIESTEQSFPLILTQAPMPVTFTDFWTMVWEQQVEIIVCLNSEAEVKGQIYWPSDVGSSCEYGQISVTLHSSCEGGSPLSCRRVLHITHRTSKLTRVIIHMQFLGWPPSALPESPGPLLQFIADVHTFQRQQRNKLREIVVHCVPGLGRSTVFTLLSAFMRELLASGSLMDLTTLLLDLNKQRRGGIQDKEHLHFVFSAALYFAQDVLMKRGILTNKATFEEGPREKTHVRHPSADLLSAYDFSRLKSKLGLDQEGGKTGSEDEHSRRNSSASLVSNGSAGFDQVLKDGQREASKESLASANSQGLTDSGCEASSVDANDTGSALESETNGLTNKPIGLLDPSFSSISPSLAASLDPQQFKIDPPVPAKFVKITKESFENVSGGSLNKKSGDPNDPFSGLDPLWSHKKS